MLNETFSVIFKHCATQTTSREFPLLLSRILQHLFLVFCLDKHANFQVVLSFLLTSLLRHFYQLFLNLFILQSSLFWLSYCYCVWKFDYYNSLRAFISSCNLLNTIESRFPRDFSIRERHLRAMPQQMSSMSFFIYNSTSLSFLMTFVQFENRE